MADQWANSSGVTLDIVHKTLAQVVAQAGILPAQAVYLVLDDEGIPQENPRFKRFVTIRLPSFVQQEGYVFMGTAAGGLANIDRLMCLGQTRVTLWMKNHSDIWGEFDEGAKAATGPEGGALLGRLMLLLWNKMLVNANQDYILNSPMRFVSYDAPGSGYRDWRPFRLTYEISFTWDLSLKANE